MVFKTIILISFKKIQIPGPSLRDSDSRFGEVGLELRSALGNQGEGLVLLRVFACFPDSHAQTTPDLDNCCQSMCYSDLKMDLDF